ncbi:hypothetical protein [Sporomusa malonica]|uniref:ABC-type transport auxiliary lipoprotein component domain-containing protein n=2 Tax=Sporomusa malonica TaxID=112901 RepID=A0A1W2E7I6_9FIRM|nr:hypothetical protein SAMN04488500_12131 [Sporomusa malonica]
MLLLFCLSNITLPAYAITPLNVAILQPINTATYKYMDDVQIIQDTIKKPFKYPYYTLMPSDTVEHITQTFLVENRSAKLTDKKSMSDLSDKLSADIIVVVELSKFRMNQIYSPWLDDTYIESNIILKCYAYSAITKKYDVIKVVKSIREPESVNTSAAFAFKELTEEILVKLPYKRIPVSNVL